MNAIIHTKLWLRRSQPQYSLRQAMRALREEAMQTPRDLILLHLVRFYCYIQLKLPVIRTTMY